MGEGLGSRKILQQTLPIELKIIMNAVLIYPHQLFEQPLEVEHATYFLLEENLFFSQYNFHKQKLLFHRASMKQYETYLRNLGNEVRYIERCDTRKFVAELANEGYRAIHCYQVSDNYLQKRLRRVTEKHNIKLNFVASPMFLTSAEELKKLFSPKTPGHASFYKAQRKRLGILVEDGQPFGGKWSFDEDNRKKYPKDKQPPRVERVKANAHINQALNYVNTHFKHNLGSAEPELVYPTNHDEAKAWLKDFLEHRFHEFGPYEDAIVAKESILNHSVLTPMLNVGLLEPQYVIDEVLTFAGKHDIPLNSLEGFIRQVIGWREYIHGLYVFDGVEQRTSNYWSFTHSMPKAFYTAETGVEPIDQTIRKLQHTGYCHHIERLMILGNFMLLCEIAPDAVYQWFMEFFIDAYDWVMVPNVYGMSQFADGGIMATKPYISGSNYVLKMSDYKKGDWCTIWDGLFWRFMLKHRDFFQSNPRLAMLLRNYDRMSAERKNLLDKAATDFLNKLHN